MPSCQHSTSTAALVVSTTATTWPRVTVSPGLTSHSFERPLVHVRAERRHLELDHDGLAEEDFTAATILSGCGSAASSRCLAYGIGTSALQTRAIGASRS